MHPERIAAVVLAAGASSRMGRNKLLLELEGETVVRRAVRHAAAAVDGEVVVVVGHEAERVAAETAGLRRHVVVNAEFATGMSTSLRAGLEVLAASIDGAVVVLADMPFVTAGMIAVVAERGRAGGGLVVSLYGGATVAPPIFYHRRFFSELGAGDGDGGGKRVIRQHPAEVEVVSWPASRLADLDVPEDYARLRAELRLE